MKLKTNVIEALVDICSSKTVKMEVEGGNCFKDKKADNTYPVTKRQSTMDTILPMQISKEPNYIINFFGQKSKNLLP